MGLASHVDLELELRVEGVPPVGHRRLRRRQTDHEPHGQALERAQRPPKTLRLIRHPVGRQHEHHLLASRPERRRVRRDERTHQLERLRERRAAAGWRCAHQRRKLRWRHVSPTDPAARRERLARPIASEIAALWRADTSTARELLVGRRAAHRQVLGHRAHTVQNVEVGARAQ